MLAKILQQLKQRQLDALWITDRFSINYISGYDVDCGERFIGLLITKDGTVTLVLNRLFKYAGQLPLTVKGYFDYENVAEILAQLTPKGLIGVDKWMPAQFLLPLIQQKADCQFVIGSDCVDEIRAIKSEQEIAKMKVASQINDAVISKVPTILKEGISELAIRDQILAWYAEAGVVPSFEAIVLFGDHAADPHGIPSERTLKIGEPIVVDIGCRKDGFCSDMTRTFFLGYNPLEKEYNAVKEANQQAIKAIKSGMRFCDIDAIARNIIKEAGYVEQFNHRLGHGIGHEVHEPYDVSGANERLIKPGMCFSIEPGIYQWNEFGIRIEDLVYIKADGTAELLNYVDRDNPVIKV